MTYWINLKMNALEYCNFMRRYGEFPVGFFYGDIYIRLIPDLVVNDAKED